ncbi:MAG: TIGR01244 family phosphatase [Rhizobium sp.]|nr:MAG: TIGR01244 family phosphatase [Rhizobium sp.]
MHAVRINDHLTVSSQPDPSAFRDLAGEGIATLINLRPDDEEANQPGNAAECEAAREAGLGYAFIPVSLSKITEGDVQAFRQAVSEAKGHVLAHCKSGTRALVLHVLGEVLVGRMKREEVDAFGKSKGFDLSSAIDWLDRQNVRVPRVKGFHDARTGSIQYVVIDPATGACAIIDPVFDFDEKSGATATTNADAILDYVKTEGLTLEWILDTHPHADHFSAAFYLKRKTGAPTAIGADVIEVQKLWKDIYNWPELATNGSQWDRLFQDGDTFKIGSLDARAMFSPGHTLASVTYVVADAAFVHDTVFMPDSGTARADFPGGSASMLWNSIQQILALPDDTRVFTGHDYQPGGRNAKWESTVGEQKRSNRHLADMTEERFVALREARDRTLPMPKLILHALQVNVCGGRLPEPESNGRRYLKFPLDALEGAAW